MNRYLARTKHSTLPQCNMSEKDAAKPQPIGDAPKDIGSASTARKPPQLYTELQSRKQPTLQHIFDKIGNTQVNLQQLEFAPPWILDEAFEEEHDGNWKNAYTTTPEKEVPQDANVITSHVVYKIKTAETGEMKLKARIVPHGNRDKDKEDIRKDSSTAQFNCIRLLLSIAAIFNFRLALADIKAAYLQSGPIKRDIYVRPPREWTGDRSLLWKLTLLPYGIAEAGRQWATTIENWMIDVYGMRRVFGISQLYTVKDRHGTLSLIVAKVTDDFLIAGAIDDINNFANELGNRFEIGKFVLDRPFFFNGCELSQTPSGTITLSMAKYLLRVKPIELSRTRRKEQAERATQTEVSMLKSLAGVVNFLGSGALPQATYIASWMQQCTTQLTVEHLVETNNCVRELLKLDPIITFNRVCGHKVLSSYVCTFADAAFNVAKTRSYGQTGLITGLLTNIEDGGAIYHIVDWTSNKQRRVCYSSYGAEILAAADADDRGYHLKTAYNSIFSSTRLKHKLQVDSHALYDTITTLHEGRDFRLRQTVERIRNSFESCDLDTLRWIPGHLNIADALTKRNLQLFEKLNKICTSGELDIDFDVGKEHDSIKWK